MGPHHKTFWFSIRPGATKRKGGQAASKVAQGCVFRVLTEKFRVDLGATPKTVGHEGVFGGRSTKQGTQSSWRKVSPVIYSLKPKANGVVIPEGALRELSDRIGMGEINPSLGRLQGYGEERKRPLEGPRTDGEGRKTPPEVPGKGSKRVKSSHTYTSSVQDNSELSEEELLEAKVRLSVAEALQ